MDWITISVFTGYFAAVLLIGFRAGSQEKHTADDYFLAGRKLPWYAIGLSMAGSNISTEHFIGMLGTAYLFGISPANWELIAFIPLSLLLFLFLPYYFRQRIYTIPQFLEARYNQHTRLIFAVIIIIHGTIAILAGALYAGGILFQELFVPGQVPITTAGQISPSLVAGIIILALTTGLYSVKGGLAAVVWTDVVQTLLLLAGGLIVAVIAINQAGGWQAMWLFNQSADSSRIHLIRSVTDPVAPWTGVLTIWFTISVWYNCANQFYIQQCFAARSEWDARMGIILVAFLKLLTPLIVVIPGMAALSIYGQGIPPDKVFIQLVQDLVPVGLRSLVLTGMVAAIMSTVSSVLNSIATVFTIDVYKRYLRKDATHRQLIYTGRWAVTSALFFATVCAPFILLLGQGLFIYIQDLASYFAPPISVIFLAGILWKRASGKAANVTLLAGIGFGILLKLLSGYAPEAAADFLVPFLNRALISWVFSLLTMVAVSLADIRFRPGSLASDIIWRPAYVRLPEAETSRNLGLKNFMIWWSIVLALRVLVYALYA
jgi:solute:Na+ symporter, SSS family